MDESIPSQGSPPPDMGLRKRKYDGQDDGECSLFVSQNTTTTHRDSEDGSGSESDSDESSLDNDITSGEVSSYDEACEPKPNCSAYEKDFAQVGQDLNDVAKDLLNITGASKCKNRRVQGYETNARELTKIPETPRERVGLLGNTGAGKSSFLNSLLGTPNLARAMSGGQSCTSVGTQYESPLRGQTKMFASWVEYFTIEEIETHLKKQLKDYNIWTFSEDMDWDDCEKEELSRLASTAFNIFRSLFCDKTEFESPFAAQEFLEACNKEGRDAIMTFKAWCEEILAANEADTEDRCEYIDADTQDELHSQLNPLVFASSRFQEPTLWPLVKKVRIGIEGVEFLKYYTLVDFPGIDDTNTTRVEATMEAMKSCDSLWIVAKIDRAEISIDSLLMRYGKLYKVAVILTGTDDNLSPQLATWLQQEGQSIGDHDALLIQERDLRARKRRLPKKIESRTEKLEDRGKPSKAKKKRPLTEKTKQKLQRQITEFEDELGEVKRTLPKVASERFEVLFDARLSLVRKRLVEEKSQYLPAGKTLTVFGVSNLHYSAIKGAENIDGPQLSVRDTGIPDVRTWALECAAPAVMKTIEKFIAHSFTVFLQGLSMWARSVSVVGCEKLLELIKAPQERTVPLQDTYVDELMKEFNRSVVDTLDKDQEEAVAGALKRLQEKSTWHWASMRAFIRRDGNTKTPMKGKESWNEQFQEAATKTLEAKWHEFKAEETQLHHKLTVELVSLVKGALKGIKSEPASMVLPMERVEEIFGAQVRGIEYACEQHQTGLTKALRNVLLDATRDSPTGYFHQAMSEAYKTCQADRGPGVKGRSIAVFNLHLRLEGKRSPFAIMAKKMTQAISKEAKAHAKTLRTATDHMLEELYRQFDDMVDTEIDDHSEEELRKQLAKFLDRVEPKFEDIKADLARIKRRYGQ